MAGLLEAQSQQPIASSTVLPVIFRGGAEFRYFRKFQPCVSHLSMRYSGHESKKHKFWGPFVDFMKITSS